MSRYERGEYKPLQPGASSSQKSWINGAKLGCGAIAVITAVVGMFLVLLPGTHDTFEQTTLVNQSLRRGNTTAIDGYPAIDSEPFGVARVGLTATFAALFAAIGFFVMYFMRSAEYTEMERGSNPYVWVFMLLWNVPYFLVVLFVAGITDVFELTTISIIVCAWIFLFWLDGLMHSNRGRAAIASSDGAYDWIPVAMIAFLALSVYVIICVHMGYTFGADASPSLVLIAIPISLLLLYLIVPITYFVWRYDYIHIATRDLVIYVASGVMVLVCVWLSLGLFTCDGITPTHSTASVAGGAVVATTSAASALGGNPALALGASLVLAALGRA